MQHKDWGIEGPSDLYAEVWGKDLARIFHEHHQTQEEETGVGNRLRELELEDGVPKDLDDVESIPGININSVVGENNEVVDCGYQENEFDMCTPLDWEKMMGFDVEKAREMKEAERGYEEWLEKCRKWDEIEVVNLLSESSDPKWTMTLIM